MGRWNSIFRIDDKLRALTRTEAGPQSPLASTAVPSTRGDIINITTKSASVKTQKGGGAGRKWYSIFRIDRIDESVPVPARKPGTLGHLASTAVPSTRQDIINLTTKFAPVKTQKKAALEGI